MLTIIDVGVVVSQNQEAHHHYRLLLRVILALPYYRGLHMYQHYAGVPYYNYSILGPQTLF